MRSSHIGLVTFVEATSSEGAARCRQGEISMSTIGEQLVHVDRQTGVTRVYGVVGDSLNPFVDAIRPTKGIDWIVLDAENSP